MKILSDVHVSFLSNDTDNQKRSTNKYLFIQHFRLCFGIHPINNVVMVSGEQ